MGLAWQGFQYGPGIHKMKTLFCSEYMIKVLQEHKYNKKNIGPYLELSQVKLLVNIVSGFSRKRNFM